MARLYNYKSDKQLNNGGRSVAASYEEGEESPGNTEHHAS